MKKYEFRLRYKYRNEVNMSKISTHSGRSKTVILVASVAALIVTGILVINNSSQDDTNTSNPSTNLAANENDTNDAISSQEETAEDNRTQDQETNTRYESQELGISFTHADNWDLSVGNEGQSIILKPQGTDVEVWLNRFTLGFGNTLVTPFETDLITFARFEGDTHITYSHARFEADGSWDSRNQSELTPEMPFTQLQIRASNTDTDELLNYDADAQDILRSIEVLQSP